MTQATHATPAVTSRLPGSNQILFCDFDGPIADVSQRYYATYCSCLEQMQQETASTQIYCLPQSQFWTFKQNRIPDRQIALWSGLTGTEIDRFLALVAERVNCQELLAYDQPQPLAAEALQHLNLLGIRVVLVTLRSHIQVRQFLDAHGLNHAISDIYGSSSIQAAYTNRAEHKINLLRWAIRAQQQQGFNPSNCFMVGDTEADILAGQAVDLPTVALTCGIRSRSYLRSFCPTYIKADLWMAVQQLVKPAFTRFVYATPQTAD